MSMTFVIIENLRSFFHSRPPLVVFMICLASFAVALITFAYIVKTKDLPNPDVTEDWNSFLEKISRLKFCVSSNATSHNTSGVSSRVGDRIFADTVDSIKDKLMDTKLLQRQARDVHSRISEFVAGPEDTTWSPNKVASSKDDFINETFNLNIEFVLGPELQDTIFKSTHLLLAEFPGMLLNMKGSHKEELILMAVTFPANNSHCVGKTARTCSINSCITFTGPRSALPHSRHIKESSCGTDIIPVTTTTSGVTTTTRVVSVSTVDSSNNWCSHGTTFTVQYLFDDSLTVLLSQEDRSAINLHLMRTSYFLFVMVVTLFCYAAVKGRPGKVKAVVYAPVDKIKISTSQ